MSIKFPIVSYDAEPDVERRRPVLLDSTLDETFLAWCLHGGPMTLAEFCEWEPPPPPRPIVLVNKAF